MRYTPKSEQVLADKVREEQEARMIPEGIYEFTVIEANLGTSKKGYPMFSLKLNVFGNSGYPSLVYDWLLTNSAYSQLKFAKFMKSIGMEDLYNSGCVDEYQISNRSGFVKIIHESVVDKDGKPRTNLRVDEYVEKPTNYVEPTKEEMPDDDIPF